MQITRWAGAAVCGAALALATATPGYAQDEPAGHFPDAGWQVRQIGPDAVWVDAELSMVTGPTAVELTKPAGDTGTSIETTDLGLPVAAGDTITVAYEMTDGALPDAGAVRLFWYDTADADTMTEAPTAFVAADAMSGTLSLVIGADAQVGTFGLTYDASNVSAGTVRFTGLMVGDTAVLFQAPPEPEPTGEPTAQPTEPPAGGGGEKPGLPVTGASLPLLVLGGAGLAGAGGLALWAARRRRPTFTA